MTVNKTLDVAGLTPKQIELVEAIITAFKSHNYIQSEEGDTPLEQIRLRQVNLADLEELFFESEILQPFERSLLYDERQ